MNNDSFITFGALNDATTFDPAPYKDQGVISKETIPTAEIEARIEKGDVELSDSTGSAKTNGLLTESTEISPLVSNKWYGLKSCPGATDYVENDNAAWHLDGEINLYNVTYNKGEIDEEPTLPKETTYFLGDYTVRKMETSSQNYKFLGWEYEGKLLQEGHKIEAPKKDITLTAKWEKKPVVYKVNYDWGTPAPSDQTCPTNGNSYETEAAVPMDTTFDSNSTSNANNGEQEGLWTFSGWTKDPTIQTNYGDDVITKTITYKGTWSFKAKEPTSTLTLTFKIRGGTWDGTAGNNEPIVYSGCVPGEDGYCFMPDGTKLPTGMVADDNHIADSGKWYRLNGTNEILVENIHTEKFNVDTTYIFVFAQKPAVQPDTILDVLNKKVTIEKFFRSQYGYSTEGTFTATAKVMVIPDPEMSSYTDEVDVSSDNNTNTPGTDNAKTFTGTVNLKTGETKAFKFSAGAGVTDVLEPYKHYAVYISEVEGNLSKVTYDTTKYILTFDTNGNNEVSTIRIAKDEGSEKERSEQEPETVDKITFHNIYTYKRHHSSSDDGNGGGKKEEKPTVEIKDDDALGLNNTDHFAYIVGYGNGEVRPQNSITRAEVAAIFFRLLEDDVRDANYTRQNKFTDVSNDAWYCSAVSTLSAMGIISGYPDATFRPNASITRAEFAAIATRFDVNGDKTPASFNDIADHWAKDEIAVAANNGWVNGYEDGSFRPQNKITRAETMSLVNRVLNRKPETAEDLLENMAKWTDNADTNAWYYLAVQEATNSHYYEYKENSQYEKWTELRETRDWSELDK